MKRLTWGLIVLTVIVIITIAIIRLNNDNRVRSPIPIEEGVNVIYVTPRQ